MPGRTSASGTGRQSRFGTPAGCSMAGPCWSSSRGKPLPPSLGATRLAPGARTVGRTRAKSAWPIRPTCRPAVADAGRLSDEGLGPKGWPGQERDASPFYDTLKQIHAAWLLTPREDLGGAARARSHWSGMTTSCGTCKTVAKNGRSSASAPAGLEESSHAFRYGGFGTHELVKYYELVRDLLWSCWEHLTEPSRLGEVGHRPESFMVGDFLATEVPRLERVREAWLDAPDPECHGRTPRSIIGRERTRLPEGLSGHEAIDRPRLSVLPDVGRNVRAGLLAPRRQRHGRRIRIRHRPPHSRGMGGRAALLGGM